ncbi:hypothetical protein BDZ89DRAFT_1158070 [Hymenopellis radicata]|nr:hypothetical protein BDZ89DRAFT_1158070 [Hymenopellis radicata]
MAKKSAPSAQIQRHEKGNGRSEKAPKNRGNPPGETNAGPLTALDKKRSKPTEQKKRGAQIGRTSDIHATSSAKRPRLEVGEEGIDSDSRSNKMRKIELQQSFSGLPKLLSACSISLTFLGQTLSRQMARRKRRGAKSAKSSSASSSSSFAAAARWLAASSSAASGDALRENLVQPKASTSNLDITSSTRPQSASIIVSSIDLPKATDSRNDRVHNHAIQAGEADERPKPSKTEMTVRFAQEVEVFQEGSPRRVDKRKRRGDNGDNAIGLEDDEESRKVVMKPGRLKERVVGYWTVCNVSPTPSPAKCRAEDESLDEDTDEEEVDELDSSPMKPSPTYRFAPPRKRRRVDDVISSEDNATNGDEDVAQEVNAVVDFPHLREVGTSVARSPSPKTPFGRDEPDTRILSPKSLRKRKRLGGNDNVDASEAPSPIRSPKVKKTVEKTEVSEELQTRSKPVSTPNKLIQPKSEPDTPKAPKRKRQSLTPKDDLSPSRKKAKSSIRLPRRKTSIRLHAQAYSTDTKPNWSGKAKEETPDQLKDEEEVDTWEQELYAMERQIYEHLQEKRRREKEQREEKSRADEARRKQEKLDQVQALREKREEHKKKWQRLHRVKPVRHVKKEDEVRKEKSRVGEMLRIERKLENSKIRRAKMKKAQKWRNYRNAV